MNEEIESDICKRANDVCSIASGVHNLVATIVDKIVGEAPSQKQICGSPSEVSSTTVTAYLESIRLHLEGIDSAVRRL